MVKDRRVPDLVLVLQPSPLRKSLAAEKNLRVCLSFASRLPLVRLSFASRSPLAAFARAVSDSHAPPLALLSSHRLRPALGLVCTTHTSSPTTHPSTRCGSPNSASAASATAATRLASVSLAFASVVIASLE